MLNTEFMVYLCMEWALIHSDATEAIAASSVCLLPSLSILLTQIFSIEYFRPENWTLSSCKPINQKYCPYLTTEWYVSSENRRFILRTVDCFSSKWNRFGRILFSFEKKPQKTDRDVVNHSDVFSLYIYIHIHWRHNLFLLGIVSFSIVCCSVQFSWIRGSLISHLAQKSRTNHHKVNRSLHLIKRNHII